MELSRRRALGILAAAGLAATSSPDSPAEFRTTLSESMPDTVLFQNGDDLTESNLARLLARSNSSDYVERGLSFSPNHRNSTLTIGSGMAVIADPSTNRGYVVLAEQRRSVSLPSTNGTNHVYLTIDPSKQDSISIQINGDNSPPSNPSLKIGVVDTAHETSRERNRAPDLETGDIKSAGATVYDASTNTVGDGTTGANHESVSTDESRTATQPVYDVTHPNFGANGDGSSDDTAAVQEAIDAAAADGGGTVYVPVGVYETTGLTLPPGVSLRGEGAAYNRSFGVRPDLSIIRLADDTDDALLTVESGQYSEAKIERLCFDGNRANNTSGHIIHGGAKAVVFEDVAAFDAPQSGIVWDQGGFAHFERVHVVNPREDGVRVEPSTNGDVVFEGCEVQNPDQDNTSTYHGMYLEAGNTKIIGCKLAMDNTDGGDGIHVASGSGYTHIIGTTVRNITGTGILDDGDNTHIVGCEIRGSGVDGIHANGGHGVIYGNNIRGDGTGASVHVGTSIHDAYQYAIAGNSRLVNSGEYLNIEGETRCLFNGWGLNNGDPNLTGQWSGGAYTGIGVIDTANNQSYVWGGGQWV